MGGPNGQIFKNKEEHQEFHVEEHINQPLLQLDLEQLEQQRLETKERKQKREIERVNTILIRNAKVMLTGDGAQKKVDEELEDKAYGRPTFARKKDRDNRIEKDRKNKKKVQSAYKKKLQKELNKKDIEMPENFDQRSVKFLEKSELMEKQLLEYREKLKKVKSERELDRITDALKYFQVNEKGEPLTKKDRANKEWNDRFVEDLIKASTYAVDSPESEAIYFEQYDKIMEEVLAFELDESKMYNPNWILNNYEEVSRYTRVALSSSDLLYSKKEPRLQHYHEHLKEKPYYDLLMTKLDLLHFYTTVVRTSMMEELGVVPYKIKQIDGEQGVGICKNYEVEENRTQGITQSAIESVKGKYAQYEQKRKEYLNQDDPEMWNNIAVNGPIDETTIERSIREADYLHYVEAHGHADITLFNFHHVVHRQYKDKKARYFPESTRELWKKIGEANGAAGGEALDRMVLGFLRDVHFKLDGTPETEEDQRNYDWNMRFIATFSEGNNAEERKPFLKDICQTIIDFQLTDEMLTFPWVFAHPAQYRYWKGIQLRYSNIKNVDINKQALKEIREEFGEEKFEKAYNLIHGYVDYIDWQLKSKGLNMDKTAANDALKPLDSRGKRDTAEAAKVVKEMFENAKAAYNAG